MNEEELDPTEPKTMGARLEQLAEDIKDWKWWRKKILRNPVNVFQALLPSLLTTLLLFVGLSLYQEAGWLKNIHQESNWLMVVWENQPWWFWPTLVVVTWWQSRETWGVIGIGQELINVLEAMVISATLAILPYMGLAKALQSEWLPLITKSRPVFLVLFVVILWKWMKHFSFHEVPPEHVQGLQMYLFSYTVKDGNRRRQKYRWYGFRGKRLYIKSCLEFIPVTEDTKDKPPEEQKPSTLIELDRSVIVEGNLIPETQDGVTLAGNSVKAEFRIDATGEGCHRHIWTGESEAERRELAEAQLENQLFGDLGAEFKKHLQKDLFSKEAGNILAEIVKAASQKIALFAKDNYGYELGKATVGDPSMKKDFAQIAETKAKAKHFADAARETAEDLAGIDPRVLQLYAIWTGDTNAVTVFGSGGGGKGKGGGNPPPFIVADGDKGGDVS